MRGSLMLINPSKRPSKRKKPRTAAQKAATKRMLASRKSSPVKAKRRSASSAMSAITSRRKNPIGGGIVSMFMPAAKGALGAVVINTIENQLISGFVPVDFRGNVTKYATRIGLAIALGTVGGKLIGNANARQAAEGALVVTLHDVIVTTVNAMLPAGKTGLSAYAPNAIESNSGMGAYAPFAGANEGAFSYES